MKRFFLVFCGFLALMGCEAHVDMRFAESGTVSITQTILLDEEGCRIAVAEGANLKCDLNSDNGAGLNFDPALGKYVGYDELLVDTPLDEFAAADDLNVDVDYANRQVSLRIPKDAFQNLSRGPASLEDAPSSPLSPELAAAFAGKEVEVVITAAEILESNGEISADRKSVTFRLPSAFVFAGQGARPYEVLEVKLRY